MMSFKTKILKRVSALVSAWCEIRKEQHLSFHWKKINVVTFFDDFLSPNELWRVLRCADSILRNKIRYVQNREERKKLNALSNKKWRVWHTVMIQRALYSPDPAERFTYSERMHMTREKVSMGFWSHSLRQSPTQNGKLDRVSGIWISKFHSKVTFPSIKSISFVARSRFNPSWPHLGKCLHTQNVCVRRMKNFLPASEVKCFARNPHKIIPQNRIDTP